MTIENLTGCKVRMKETADIMCENFIEAGTTGYVVRHDPEDENETLLFVAFNEAPSGIDQRDVNWFVDASDVEVIPSEVDGMRIARMKNDLFDDDGLILKGGSIGFVIRLDEGDTVASVAFPKQDGRRFAGVLIGEDDLVLHHIDVEKLELE